MHLLNSLSSALVCTKQRSHSMTSASILPFVTFRLPRRVAIITITNAKVFFFHLFVFKIMLVFVITKVNTNPRNYSSAFREFTVRMIQ